MNNKIIEDLDAISEGIDQLARERDEAYAKIQTVSDAITPWMLARGITGVHATDAVKLLVDEAGDMRERLAQAEADARMLTLCIDVQSSDSALWRQADVAAALKRWRTCPSIRAASADAATATVNVSAASTE